MVKDKEIQFSKLVGTGNDFVFIDSRTENLSKINRAQLTRALCDRHFGVGADGVVFIDLPSPSSSADLLWDFYNSDGSSAEMCGNAARCMGRWAQQKLNKESVRFETKHGIISASILGAGVQVALNVRSAEPKEIDPVGTQRSVHLIDSGVPHVVVEMQTLEEIPSITNQMMDLRWHTAATKAGANVTFFQRLSDERLKTVTFERGVEGFTLSCGTGVIAAALTALRGSSRDAIDLETPGGELRVSVHREKKEVVLFGAAENIFEGTWLGVKNEI